MSPKTLFSKILLLPFVLTSIIGCATTKESYRGSYNGQTVKIFVRNEKSLFASVNHVTYFVQLGKLRRIPIGAENIDLYGAPYDASIYKSVPHQFFENPVTNTETTPVGTPVVEPTMLYFDPAEYDRKTYDAYAAFFAQGWPAINKEFNKDYPYLDKQIIGTAYGRQRDFVQLFVGREEEGKAYYFDIQPDGSIQYHSGAGPEESTGFQGSGLAGKVEMPGRIIRIEYPDMLSSEKLRRYKDKAGKSMEDYFTVVEGKK